MTGKSYFLGESIPKLTTFQPEDVNQKAFRPSQCQWTSPCALDVHGLPHVRLRTFRHFQALPGTPTTYYQIPTTSYLPSTLRPTSYHLLPAIYYLPSTLLLLTTYFSNFLRKINDAIINLLIHCLLLVQGSWLPPHGQERAPALCQGPPPCGHEQLIMN